VGSVLIRSTSTARSVALPVSQGGSVPTVGSDGVGLFDDDVACDVRAMYRQLLEDGVADSDVESGVLEAFAEALDDPDDGPAVWLALAWSQSKLGRLDERVLNEAIAVLDTGADLRRWSEAGPHVVRRREAVLTKVRRQLEGPQPPRKAVRRPAKVASSVAVGQVLAYRARAGHGRVHLLRVVAVLDTRGSEAPVVRFLDYAAMEPPEAGTLQAIPDRAAHPVRWHSAEQAVIETRRERASDLGFTVIGVTDRQDGEVAVPDVWGSWRTVALFVDGRDRAMDSADY
jgi:hypothetical protein